MAKKNYEELSAKIIENVGSKDNVSRAYHCITRLRFNVKDKDLVKLDELKKLDGVINAQWSGDQLQVIIGQEVNDVYKVLCKVGGFQEEKGIDENLDTEEKKKFSL